MKLPGSKRSAAATSKSPPPPAAPPPTSRPPSFPPTAGSTVRAGGPPPGKTLGSAQGEEFIVDLKRRREQLVARVAELQWDLGGLTYEMAIRNSIKVDVLVKRAAE